MWGPDGSCFNALNPAANHCIVPRTFFFRSASSFAARKIEMSEPDRGRRPPRSWQAITEEASHETDPQTLAELAEELDRALAERDKKLSGPSKRRKSA
jgi:hypothetical protein